jgi:hypothetical protein
MYLDECMDRMTAIVAFVGLAIQTVTIFGLFGYFGSSTELSSPGFGLYSADLLTFFNPGNYSRWIPTLPMGEGQYEGYGYLGVGMLALAVVALGMSLVRGSPIAVPPRARPLVVAGALMGVFALSNHVTVAGYEVLTMRKFYDIFATAVGPLRASGRFIWPLHYLLMTGILALVVGKQLTSRKITNVGLAAAIAIQVAEIRPEARMSPADRNGLQSAAWQGVGASYRHLALYPPYYAFGPAACQKTSFTFDDTIELMELAYRERMTLNSAYLARTSEPALGAYCEQLRREVAGGWLRRNTVYVVSAEMVKQFTRPGVNAVCGTLDDFNVCVEGDSSEDFRDILYRTKRR